MALRSEQFEQLASGLRLMRWAWILSLLGVGQVVWQNPDVPWLILGGMLVAGVGWVRCLLGSPSNRCRRTLGGLALLVLGVLALDAWMESTMSVWLGFTCALFGFHYFVIQLTEELGLDEQRLEFQQLFYWPLLALVSGLCCQLLAIAVFPLMTLVPMVLTLVVPLLWIFGLLRALARLELELG